MHVHEQADQAPDPRHDPSLEHNVSGFITNLAHLQEAGLPLLRSLRILEATAAHPGLKPAVTSVSEEVEGGSSLSEAMAKHPKVFEPVVVKMVAAGEIGGVLDICLTRLSDLLEFVPPTIREGRISDVSPEGRKFLFTLGTMVGAGVPILEAIKVSGERCGGEVQSLAQRAHAAVREGEAFADGLGRDGSNPHFGPVTMAMIDVGEETGDFDVMCIKAAKR